MQVRKQDTFSLPLSKDILKSLQDENSCSFFVMEYFPVKLLLHQPALLMIDEADNGFIS